MTFSPLTAYTIPTHGKYSPRYGASIIRLNEHHWASTRGGLERMQDPDANVSCNYLILSDGRLVGQVPEEYRAWTTGSPAADNPAITVEIQNSGGPVNGDDSNPNSWPVTDAAFATLCALLADLHRRYGWTDMGPARLRGHREFVSTACPGGYLWARRDKAREGALSIINGGNADPLKGFEMPVIIKHPNGSLGFISDAGELDAISDINEANALFATIVKTPTITLPNPQIWDLYAARTARLRAARAAVDPAALASNVAPLLVPAVVGALEDVTSLTVEEVETAVETATKKILREAGE